MGQVQIMAIKKFDLANLGKNMQKTFGWEWPTEATRRPNWWEKLKIVVGTFGKKMTTPLWGKGAEEAAKGVGKEEVRDIRKDATDVITSHANYSPQELADALKQKGHKLEAIQQLSPRLKAVK